MRMKRPGTIATFILPTKNGRADPLPSSKSCQCLNYFLFTAFLSSAPGVNFATLRAAILIVAPVCGLRPLRALRCETEKVPNPIKATRSPFRRAAVKLSTAVSIAVVACAFEMLQAPAIRSTRSALFMLSPDTCYFGSRACTGEGKHKTLSPNGSHFPLGSRIVNGKHVPDVAFRHLKLSCHKSASPSGEAQTQPRKSHHSRNFPRF